MKLFIVERTGNFGAINENGVEIIKPEYSELQVNGIYIYAKKGDEQKVFNDQGKQVNIPFSTVIEKTNNPEYFLKRQENKYGIIDSKNNIIIEIQYDMLQEVKNTNMFQAINFDTNITHIYNNELKLTLEMIDANMEIIDDQIRVYNESEEYYLDKNGNKIEKDKKQ